MTEWFDEEFEGDLRFGMRVHRRLFDQQSDFQRVEIFETAYGRTLAIDGLLMTSERDEFFYHELLVQPAMVVAPDRRRVLIVGGGDGGTAREVLAHRDVEHVRMIEIDRVVIEACKEHLPAIGTAWDDPRLDVQIADGIAYVKESDEPPYDLIFLDGTDPVGPGEGLFNLDFYRGVARMLKPEGIFAVQSDSAFLSPVLWADIQRALRTVFSAVHPYFGAVPLYSAGDWSWSMCRARPFDPLVYDADRMAEIALRSKAYNPDLHRAAFARPNYVQELLERSE